VADRKNHLIGHVLAYVAGDTSDDHLGAILANAGMLAEIEAMREARAPNLTYDERRTSHLKPCECGRLFTHPERCLTQGRCLALDHPHAK